MKKRVLAMICALALLVPFLPSKAKAVISEIDRIGDWVIGIEDTMPNRYLIQEYTGNASTVTVPKELGGRYTIYGIHSFTFLENTTMKVLNVPDDMVVYGLGRCDVETVNLGDGVTLSGSVFSGCEKLKTVNLPEDMGTLPADLFNGCVSLETVKIPSTVKVIGGSAFEGCTSLKTLSLPDGVEEIHSGAFKNCTALTSLVLPEGVTEILSNGFKGCTSLTSINIPKSLMDLSQDAFTYCDNLTTFNVAEGHEKYFNNPDGSVAYYHEDWEVTYLCFVPACENYTVPSNIDRVDDYVFTGATKLKKIVIPAHVTEIGQRIFKDCINLKEIWLEGHPFIGPYAFENINATVYYPGDVGEFTDSYKDSYEGNVTWVPYCTGVHTGPIGTVITEATCTATGQSENVCDLCGETYIYEIPMKEHAYDDGVVTKEAICMTDGELTYTCADCGHFYTEEIPCPGHKIDPDDSKGEILQEATCTEKGLIRRKCLDCDYTIDCEIPALDHDFDTGDPVFDADLHRHSWPCSRCDLEKVELCVFDDGTVTTEATPDQLGVTTYTCTVCGGNYEETYVCRIYGSSRYDTAYAVADALKEQLGVDEFENIIVASGAGYADALAGSYLAAVKNAPILLVNKNRMEEVAEYIRENLAADGMIYLLGGDGAVPAEMEEILDGFNMKRLSGKNRYETNMAILEEAGTEGQEILICTGRDFPDSLSASAVGKPILLVNKTLNDYQKEFLEESSGEFVIIGGTGAVSEELEAELAEFGEITRLGGSGRYETCVKVAEYFFPEGAESAIVAYSRNFPDGLCGGALAYAMKAPLLLLQTDRGPEVIEYASEAGIKVGAVLGGASLIDDATVNKVFVE